jgi:hypothetical protein
MLIHSDEEKKNELINLFLSLLILRTLISTFVDYYQNTTSQAMKNLIII